MTYLDHRVQLLVVEDLRGKEASFPDPNGSLRHQRCRFLRQGRRFLPAKASAPPGQRPGGRLRSILGRVCRRRRTIPSIQRDYRNLGGNILGYSSNLRNGKHS